jgi:hypothetical protein
MSAIAWAGVVLAAYPLRRTLFAAPAPRPAAQPALAEPARP